MRVRKKEKERERDKKKQRPRLECVEIFFIFFIFFFLFFLFFHSRERERETPSFPTPPSMRLSSSYGDLSSGAGGEQASERHRGRKRKPQRARMADEVLPFVDEPAAAAAAAAHDSPPARPRQQQQRTFFFFLDRFPACRRDPNATFRRDPIGPWLRD